MNPGVLRDLVFSQTRVSGVPRELRSSKTLAGKHENDVRSPQELAVTAPGQLEKSIQRVIQVISSSIYIFFYFCLKRVFAYVWVEKASVWVSEHFEQGSNRAVTGKRLKITLWATLSIGTNHAGTAKPLEITARTLLGSTYPLERPPRDG